MNQTNKNKTKKTKMHRLIAGEMEPTNFDGSLLEVRVATEGC